MKIHTIGKWVYWYNRKLRMWEAAYSDNPTIILIQQYHDHELKWQMTAHEDQEAYKDNYVPYICGKLLT